MLIHLDKAASQPLFEQLYTIIKSQILNGDRGADEKLPSKRQLQEDLSVSQTTIEHAYHLLVDEDLIYSKEKSGYYVSAIEQLKQVDAPGTPDIERPRKKEYRLPLGTIDTSLVQSDALKQIAREIYSDAELLNKGEDSGESRLKAQIQKYLHLSRGVTCSIDQIFIGPSTEFLLEQVLYLLKYPRMTIEDPGYPVIQKVLEKYDGGMDPARVFSDGIDIGQVAAYDNPVVHVTPSHQFPSGAVMSLKKRIQLLNYAGDEGHYIIEDDYDSEFRYTGRPLPSLQGLDQNDRTIYMSTFSKSLYPSLRLSCMVLPPALAELYYKKEMACNVPRQNQHIVARFMEDGYFNRHINRMRKVYKKKMEEITSWVRTHYAVHIEGEHTGMHFILRLKGKNLKDQAIEHGLVHGDAYSYSNHMTDSVVIGIGEKDSDEIISILKAFLENCARL